MPIIRRSNCVPLPVVFCPVLAVVMLESRVARCVHCVENVARGNILHTVPEILQAVDRSIRTINTTGAAKGILRLPHRWQRVVHNAGDYIEGQ